MNAKVPKLSICTLVPLVTCLLCVRGGAQTTRNALPEGWQSYTLEQLVALVHQMNQEDPSKDGLHEMLRQQVFELVWPKYLARDAQVPDADRAQRNALAKALGRRMTTDHWQELLLRVAAEPQPSDIAEVLNIWLGDFVELVQRFNKLPDDPHVAAVRSQLKAYAWQQYLRPEAAVADVDRENWEKLLRALMAKFTGEERYALALRLAREGLPVHVNEMLAGDSDRNRLKSDGLEVPPPAEGFTDAQRAQVADALNVRFVQDAENLARLDYEQVAHLWSALSRCGWNTARLSDVAAAFVETADGWRSWPAEELARLLPYLRWSGSEAAKGARLEVVDVCMDRQIYRYFDDPMYAARAAMAVDAQLRDYLSSKLVDEVTGAAREVPAALLIWHYKEQERFEEWLAILNQHLQGPTEGDAKASWLLARAHAAMREVRLYTPLAGSQWISQAMATATSEPLRLRCVELLVLGHQRAAEFEQARSLLASLEQQFASEAARDAFARLRQTLAEQETLEQQRQAAALSQLELARLKGQVEFLQRRLDEARAQNRPSGDIGSIQQLLEQARQELAAKQQP
ncbi:hypothetical protein [Fontivita pretiosa]|uniref:hypothetical protein n=1 Tax=Fontivita pretiosa TaxID=2989684 RepID=UPI003D17F56F